MRLCDFLDLLLDDTLEEAREKHLTRPDALVFRGVEHAVEDCRAAMLGRPLGAGLSDVLVFARKEADLAFLEDAPDAMYWLSRAETVAWISNVVSVLLLQWGLPTVVSPTRSAAQRAVSLLVA